MADICERVPRVLRRPVHATLERLEQAAERSGHYLKALHNHNAEPEVVEADPMILETQRRFEALHERVMHSLSEADPIFDMKPQATDYSKVLAKKKEANRG
jgi:hypothetical protein